MIFQNLMLYYKYRKELHKGGIHMRRIYVYNYSHSRTIQCKDIQHKDIQHKDIQH